ncbi:MAG: ABC transporter permease [Candidatus Helarchaeota archaeon]|nr:ABC transporter permease [Candidatus Helarchaeota archaeon]
MFDRPKRILSLARKEIESLLKDKQALLIIFLLPTLVLFAIGLGTGGGSAHATIGIVDLDTTSGSAGPGVNLSVEFINTLDEIPNTDIIIFSGIAEANESLFYGEIDGFIVIPDLFEQSLSSPDLNRTVVIELYLDDTNFGGAGAVIGKVELAILNFKYEMGYIRDEVLYVPTFQFSSDSSLYRAAPFVFCITILGSTMMTAAQSIVGDVPLRRMLLTPARKTEVLLAKLMAYSLIVFFQIQILLGLAWGVFGVPLRCGYGPILILLFLIGFSGITLGLLISVLSTSRLQASQYFLLTFIIMLVLTWFGGLVFIRDAIPLYRGQQAFGIMAYKGFSLLEAGIDVMVIFLFGFISYLLAHIVFHFKKSVI